MLTPTEEAKIRTQFANNALRSAGKYGSTTICRCKLGNVDLDRTATGFKLVTQGGYDPKTDSIVESKVIAEGDKAVVRKALEPLFIIVVES